MIEVTLHCRHLSAPVILAAGAGVVIGRDPKHADVAIDVSGVSKQHCELAVSQTGVILRDLGSTNGTFVNGQVISEAGLHDGDVLDLGPKVSVSIAIRRGEGPLCCDRCHNPLSAIESARGGRYRDTSGQLYCLSCALGGAGTFALLGPYRMLQPIGQGLTGRVFEAADSRDQRRYALKLLHPAFTLEGGDDRAIRTTKRFRREIELMQMLVHPAIVAFHEGGEHGGQAYMALEYVDGEDLGSYMARLARPIGLTELGAIVETIASALELAHRRGVIHRDVKPGNVLRDRSGAIKVTDFGLARRNDSSSIVTSAGSIVGTLEFMAPEQLENATAIDGRADVYGLAATAFYLASGQRPYRAATDYELMRQVTAAPIPHLRDLWPAAPPALDALLHRAMQRELGARVATPGELARGWRLAMDGAR